MSSGDQDYRTGTAGIHSCNEGVIKALESERNELKKALNMQTDLYRGALVEIDRLKAELRDAVLTEKRILA